MKVRLVTDPAEAAAVQKAVDQQIRLAQEYVREHGGTSSEGFVRTDDGPSSVDEKD